MALHRADRGSSIANFGEAALQADPAWVTIVDQYTRRIAGYIVASQVSEEERVRTGSWSSFEEVLARENSRLASLERHE
jgi:hypothetical protein